MTRGRRKRTYIDNETYPELDAIITISECARRFPVSKSTVKYAIDSGRLAHKLIGGVMLIPLKSARKLWTENPHE